MSRLFADAFVGTLLACLTWPSAAPAQPALPRPTRVTGAPYVGDQVTETVRLSAYGTEDRQITPAVPVYRDSAGRTRINNLRPLLIEIQDPVQGVEYRLDTERKVAYRVTLPKTASPLPKQRTDGGCKFLNDPFPRLMEEKHILHGEPLWWECRETEVQKTKADLGARTIGGIPAKGTRMLIPVLRTAQPALPRPSLERGDHWQNLEYEIWRSPKLKVNILRRVVDWRAQSTEIRMNVRRAEPDPALFRPPVDFALVDLTESR